MDKQSIGLRIKSLREEIGLSLFQLSLQSGIRENTIRSWEKGTRVPSVEYVVSISRALGVTPNDLLGVGDGDESGDEPALSASMAVA